MRKVSTSKYVIAFVLTLLIFAGGILIGTVFEEARLRDSQEAILNEKVSLQSLQLQQKYIASGTTDCNALNRLLESNIEELTKKGQTVIDYEKRSVFNERQFNLQLRDYFLTEIQFYLTAKEIDQTCQRDNIKILYFYDESEQNTQGAILDYLKKRFGSRVMIFSFDSSFHQEPMISVLMTSYNITQFPSVVMEENVFHGPSNVKTLMAELCQNFKEINNNIPKECTLLNN